MKLSKWGVVAIAVALVVGGIFLTRQKPAPAPVVSEPSQTPVASQTEEPSAEPSSSPAGYSASVKAKVRGEFIASCKTKGHYTSVVCDCAADYLAKNYSEAELGKIYVQYHTSDVVPAELEAARDACTTK